MSMPNFRRMQGISLRLINANFSYPQVPLLAVLYLLSFLDRSNIGFEEQISGLQVSKY